MLFLLQHKYFETPARERSVSYFTKKWGIVSSEKRTSREKGQITD